MVCMPMGRDQNDNAARVVARGAGVRLKPSDSADAIRKSVGEVLDSPKYRESARKLGQQIAEDAQNSQVLDILEHVAVNK